MNKKFLTLILALLLLLPSLCCAQEAAVTLPQGYETSGQNYPVVYLLPEDGFTSDESDLLGKLIPGMNSPEYLEMIIVQPAFGESDDPAAVLRAAIETTDAQYRTIQSPKYRVLMGTDAGGYMAYALGLAMPEEIGAMVSIRGNFAENPWLSKLGNVLDTIELANLSNPEYLNTVYTYMDAPTIPTPISRAAPMSWVPRLLAMARAAPATNSPCARARMTTHSSPNP